MKGLWLGAANGVFGFVIKLALWFAVDIERSMRDPFLPTASHD